MRVFFYNPPKLKPSTKRIEVKDEQENVVCTFRRVYPNTLVKWCNFIFDFDWIARVEVISAEGHSIFQCTKKTPWFGRPEYFVNHNKTQDAYHITYTTWQKIAPEFKVTYQDQEYVIKKDLLDSAKFMQSDRVLAKWQMKPSDWFKARLEIEADCPIQEPGFFVALFQNIFYIGD
ncbi:tubby C-terminal domain-like protein [Paenibacillus polymyxa]|uniref:tubby C-terminal domain-like protein n=1 Tax=Paenibacillus polymyxa TaxID=1406 RepID=UPI002378ECD5|nr:hypothetical protein [Paenibacillus polymyxa]WDM23042.1 hypothetical protein J4I02_05595 [Paenibacillus polymyxa]